MIALARAAKDNPDILVSHADFLLQSTISGEPHVLIRGFAAQCALTLTDRGLLDLQPDLRQRLKNVNTSPFPTVLSKSYKHVYKQHSDVTTGGDEDCAHFGIDMGPYWFASLGNCFGVSQADVECAASRVIRIDWQRPTVSRWDEDERARQGIFNDRETSHSHGSFPRTDDLHFYLSYHAMMVVAGRLLATAPSLHDLDYSTEQFGRWLTRQGLSRTDGKWLADRRDPAPLEWPSWKHKKQHNDWPWSICRRDFDNVFFVPGGRINVWGNWATISGNHQESTHVSSALVSRDRSQALLRALQTAYNPHDYRIPDASDELQIDHAGFQLKGWIADRYPDSGLDEHDPWAGAIRYPPIVPHQFVVDLMLLSSDSEFRTWRLQDDVTNVDALWTQMWGQYREKDDDADQENGSRLQASTRFMVDFLRRMDMDLIVKIVIERRIRHSPYESRKDDDLGIIPASARLFLVRSDGSLCSI